MNEKYQIPATLSKKSIVILFFYLIIIMISSTVTTICFLYIHYKYSVDNFNNILFASIAFSTTGGCVYYIRKLYKLSLGEKINIHKDDNELKNIGTLVYFYIRPWFASIFAIIFVLGLNGGLLILNGGSNNSSTKLFELYTCLSFFIGFSSGKFLSFIESRSENLINSLSKNEL